MKWIVLIVSVHICSVGIRDTLRWQRSLDSLTLLIKNLGDITLEFVTLWLHVLDGEADDCSANLHRHCMLSFQPKLLFQQDDGSKLWRVVFDVKAIVLTFNDCVTSAHTDIINSDLTLMTSTKLELRLLWRYRQKMDVSRSVLVKRHRFKQNVIVFHIHLFWQVDDLVNRPTNLERVWIHMLADFALETLPVEWAHVLILSIWWFFLFLSKHPVFETLEMNETNGTSALAGDDKRIVLILFRAPTNSALDLIFCSLITKILHSFDLLSLFKFLIIELSFTHHDLVTFEVLDSEPYSTQFDGVKFLNFVVIFSSFILKRASNKPKSIDTFLFLVDSWGSMIKVVPFLILFQQTETSSIWVGSRINNIIRLIEINLIIVANDLSLWLSLKTHLDNIPRFVVE